MTITATFVTDSVKSGCLEGKRQRNTATSSRAAETGVDKPSANNNIQKVNLLIDIQSKVLEGKTVGYECWAKSFNLKQMAQMLSFLADNNLTDYEKLKEEAERAAKRFLDLSSDIKDKETRMAEIAELQKNISTYIRTRDVYVQYRQSGYSKKFYAAYEGDILLHKAAKKEFDRLGLKKLPTISSLKQEYATLLADKKKLYSSYREAKEHMKALTNAKANADTLLRYSDGGMARENDKSHR